MANEKGFKYEGVSPQAEEEILSFWRENRIFDKSVDARKNAKHFVFFEGPPTANGKPGVHHVETRSFKDIILRYKTMQGFFVPRRAGWDTHGLPVEVEVEKKLGLKSKKDIEAYGVAEFNKKCRESVWEYKELWEKLTERMGFWIDMENPYITYETKYIEPLWGIIKSFSDKKLLYEDYKVVPWCARCGTALSSHELAQGYEKVKEESVYIKFKIKGEDKNKTSLLAWTTTPWTLASNFGLAVNPKIDYVTIEVGGEWLILAESRLSVITEEHKIINRIKGEELVGMEYEPLYKFDLPYKVFGASFVGAEDGTGIVHLAPYGEEDFEIAKEHKVEPQMATGADGIMSHPGTAWDKAWFKKADPKIIEDLGARGLLFKKEMYEHDYPFCWRCKNPLMYFARKAWWVDVNKVRKDLLENNEKINWYPEHIKHGRFGEWLKEKKNWAFSRERYWGTPLPVWRCESCAKIKTVGSLTELDEFNPTTTNLILMRHGEAMHNVSDIVMADPAEDEKDGLTEKGKEQVRAQSHELKKEKIDVIIASPSLRTKESAEIVKKELGLNIEIETMPEFYEILVQGFHGMAQKEYDKSFVSEEERFYAKPRGAENLRELRARVMKGILEVRRKYVGKNVLIVSHGDPIWVMSSAIDGLLEKEYLNSKELPTAGIKKIKLHNWPYSSEGELDLHKPYIDEIKLKCDCGKDMTRVPEVCDVWFDSGAMPFAVGYYPDAYPADYIVEAVDQTRGWFYNLLAVSTLLGHGTPYKNVISMGHLLDKAGKKMSKSLGNIVDPLELMDKYGADAVRWYFYTINQPWDSKLFKEEDIRDVQRRFLMILWNSFVYWKTYSSKSEKKTAPKLVINKWLLAKWNSVLGEVVKNLDGYDIVPAARAIENFVTEDLSRWYIRRIREHMKHEKSETAKECSAVLGHILLELSKVLAPLAPFVAEGIYKELGGDKESVHLEDFPESKKVSVGDKKLIEEMEKVRDIVSRGLEARQKAGIKIRQPLAELEIDTKLDKDLLELIKGEVNIKEIIIGKEIKLNAEITPELREEGFVREFIRTVQDFRKELKLTPQEKVELYVLGEKNIENILEKHSTLIKKEISLLEFFAGKSEGLPAPAGVKKEITLNGEK